MEQIAEEPAELIGARVRDDGSGVSFRVWAPRCRRVEVVTTEGTEEMQRDERGYFFGDVARAGHGTLYRFRLDGGEEFPDPASRFQPEGPHGPSQVVDSSRFRWTDQNWRGLRLQGQILYEMHIGTFTREGTWQAAEQQLPELSRIGITVLEVMPVADFAGHYGWGYDGVNLYAPTRLYGTPDDFRSFINTAHSLHMAVILDTVYNHFGPDGSYAVKFSEDYFTSKYSTDWGAAINFDGDNSGPVRQFFLENVRYWIEEFHLDGLRLDATQNIYDESPDHILAAVTRQVRASARGRETIVIGENEPQQVKLIRPEEEGGFGLDGLWNDDYHHTAVVALTGHSDAYYTDYCGTPQEFVSAMKYGFLYQGQWYTWQQQPRGTPAFGIPPAAFVTFIQNHDQVANSARGLRAHAVSAPGIYKAVTTVTILGPGTPLLFQGQEFAASTPFYYFADQKPDVAERVRKGRRKFLSQWKSICNPEMTAELANPCLRSTFEACKLDFKDRERHAGIYNLHHDLIWLRRKDPVLCAPQAGSFDGAVLSQQAFLLRFFGGSHGDRLLLVNLGRDLELRPAPEPLLAPPRGMHWEMIFSTEDPRYGGCGTAPLNFESEWRIPGHGAYLLTSKLGRPRTKRRQSGATDDE